MKGPNRFSVNGFAGKHDDLKGLGGCLPPPLPPALCLRNLRGTRFIYYVIQSLKECNLIVFTMVTGYHNHHYNQFRNIFVLPQRNLTPLSLLPFFSYLLRSQETNLLYVLRFQFNFCFMFLLFTLCIIICIWSDPLWFIWTVLSSYRLLLFNLKLHCVCIIIQKNKNHLQWQSNYLLRLRRMVVVVHTSRISEEGRGRRITSLRLAWSTH